MSDHQKPGATGVTCADCRPQLSAYLDGGLVKTESMQIFLHLRSCAGCAQELARQQRLLDLLGALPQRQPPPGFDARILAAVPYDAYRAMAGLRQPRVPVFLAAEALPAWLRNRTVRWAGAGLAAVVLAGHGSGLLPVGALGVAAAGLLPETVVRLQDLGRRVVLAVGQSRRGA